MGPLGRCAGPSPLKTTGDGLRSVTLPLGVDPPESLGLEFFSFGFGSNELHRAGCAVGLSKGMTTGNQSDGLFVVHGHATKGQSDLLGRGKRIAIPIGSLRVDINQPHLHRCERVVHFSFVVITFLAEPLGLRPPIDVFLGFPNVGTTATEAEGPKAHRFESNISAQDHKVGPGNFLTIFLLDGPKKAAGLIEVGVVGPAVERCKTLGTVACSATTIVGAVGPGTVPGQSNEERAIVAVVGRPPILGICHELGEVLLKSLHVELRKLLGVVEIGVERISLDRVLMKNIDVELIGPPVLHIVTSSVLSLGGNRSGGIHHRALIDRSSGTFVRGCRHKLTSSKG